MATYILGSIGTALGGPIGGMVGAMLGGVIDRYAMMALTPNTTTTVVGPRLVEVSLTNAAEGAIIPRVVGRARMGGQVIWATQFKETKKTTTQSQGGKGGGGEVKTTTTTYSYSISFAVAFCEGNKHAQLGRVWLDSNEADLSGFNIRWYSGSETQAPDPLIQAKEGVDATPAFRGVCYLVFEDMPLADYGNRIPQVTAEIIVPLECENDPDDLQNLGTAFQMGPGTGEFAYATQTYKNTKNKKAETLNLHNNFRQPDAVFAYDQLNRFQNDLEAVSVTVAWFGTDLRAAECKIVPKVESKSRETKPYNWSVAGYTRASALQVSLNSDKQPIFQGTPSDRSVLELVDYLISQGKRVIFHPIIIMDIPEGNTLPNPYSDNAAQIGQPYFPEASKITCSPAPLYAGSPYRTPPYNIVGSCSAQVETFFTRTEGYRAMILHYANLLAARNIEAFLIGSSLTGLTSLRDENPSAVYPTTGPVTYPAVGRLVTLADDVRAILPSQVKISYAADWQEYNCHRPNDGTSDVIFHLDPIWSSSSIDFVAINAYFPLADWRDGSIHLDYDAENGPVSEYDPSYLKANVEGGEYFDWQYTSLTNRNSQTRTTIEDTQVYLTKKDWIFRQKDIRSWWSNSHRNRLRGIESSLSFYSTAWVPESKPIWFTEVGCPAVNKGANQPSAYYDPRRSNAAYPYYSNTFRDDAIQRIYLEALFQYWRDNSPVSSVYGDKMLDISNMFIKSWDVRPFPAYPANADTWSDGEAWVTGYSLSGRLDGAVLPRLIADICSRVGLDSTKYSIGNLYGPGCVTRGLYIANSTTEREVLDTLARFYQFNAYESEGKLKFSMSINTKTYSIPTDDLVLRDGQTYPVSISRKQEIDLPKSVKLTYLDEVNNFQSATVDGQKATGNSQNVVSFSFPIVADASYVRSLGVTMIHQAWRAREYGEFVLPPSYALIEQGDGLFVPVRNRTVSVRVDRLDQSTDRAIEFSGFDTTLFAPPTISSDLMLPVVQTVFQSSILEFMDIPLASDAEPRPYAPRLAAYAQPWSGGVNVLKTDGAGGFVSIQVIESRAVMGELLTALDQGPVGYWDRKNTVDIQVYNGGGLSSLSEDQVLASTSGNAIAIKNEASGLWEIIQFATASLQSSGVYRLSTLLRGQLNTEDATATAPHPIGSRWVLLDASLLRALVIPKEQARLTLDYRWGPSIYPSTDETYLTDSFSGNMRGLRPYTPCDVKGQRVSSSGDFHISWKRQTRLNGDGWEQTEVPLNEEVEQYRLIILSGPGGSVKRTLVLTSPEYVYTASAQTSDFGSLQTQIYVKIAQYGGEYGDYGGEFEGYAYMRSSS